MSSKETRTIIIRTGIFLHASRLVLIEIIFASILLVLRLPFHLNHVSDGLPSDIFSLFTILYLLVFPIKVVIIILATVQWASEYYEVRPGEIIYNRGFLYHHQKLYSLKNIQQISVKQSFWGVLFRFGTIKLYNPFFNENFYLINIQDPKKYLDIIGPMIPDLIKPDMNLRRSGDIYRK